MLLVPKQLQRVGMTGMVPYYGGRLSPAQAYAASHPSAPPPNFADPVTTGGPFARAPVPMSGQSVRPTRGPSRHAAGVAASVGRRRDHAGGVSAAAGAGHPVTGPVQVLVVGFDQPKFSGDVLAEFVRLREAGIVRLVDLLLVSRTEDGRLETLEAPEAGAADLGGLAAEVLASRTVSPTEWRQRLRSTPLQCGRSRTRYPSAAPLRSHSSSTSGPLP